MNFDKTYGDSFSFYRLKFYPKDFNSMKAELFKKIWFNRKVIFVYSLTGRFNPNDKMFENVNEKGFVYIELRNAFKSYYSILKECEKFEKDYLFIISAGNTATILSYDLTIKGYQAIDVGHITYNLEY